MPNRGGMDMNMPGGRGPDGWGGPRGQPQQPPPPPPNQQHWGGGGGGGGGGSGGGPRQQWNMPGGGPGGPGDHDSPNMGRRNPEMEDSRGTSLWGQQSNPGTMGPKTSK
jgi:hypothetical protein